jgi:hypothetical protein
VIKSLLLISGDGGRGTCRDPIFRVFLSGLHVLLASHQEQEADQLANDDAGRPLSSHCDALQGARNHHPWSVFCLRALCYSKSTKLQLFKNLLTFTDVLFQVRIFDMAHTIRASLGGKNAPLPWNAETNKRLALLVGSTIALLAIRVQIMGARLPVFTR